MNNLKAQRGSVLIFVFVVTFFVGAIAYILLQQCSVELVNRSYLRSEREAIVVNGMTRAAAAASVQSAVDAGDVSQGATIFAGLMSPSALSTGDWRVQPGATISALPGSLFDKHEPSYAPTLFPASSGIGQLAYVREGAFKATVQIMTSESAALTRLVSVNLPWAEVPSVQFQLITTTASFNADGSSPIAVTGRCFFNAGVIRSQPSNPAITEFCLTPSAPPTVSDGLALLTSGVTRASWGTADTADLVSPSAAGYAAQQSYAQLPSQLLAGGRSLAWNDTSIAPAGNAMTGITIRSINGANRLCIDLNTYFEDSALYVDCSTSDTGDAGIVIIGSSTATGAPLSIATNGRITLMGTNNRPVIIASSFPSAPTLFSAAYDGVTPGTATQTTWRGYMVFPIEDLKFSTPESWVNVGYTISGGVLFKGGVITAAPHLSLLRDDDLVEAFAAGTVKSDRFFLTFR